MKQKNRILNRCSCFEFLHVSSTSVSIDFANKVYPFLCFSRVAIPLAKFPMWRFPEIGVPQKSSFEKLLGFPIVNHPFGVPPWPWKRPCHSHVIPSFSTVGNGRRSRPSMPRGAVQRQPRQLLHGHQRSLRRERFGQWECRNLDLHSHIPKMDGL